MPSWLLVNNRYLYIFALLEESVVAIELNADGLPVAEALSEAPLFLKHAHLALGAALAVGHGAAHAEWRERTRFTRPAESPGGGTDGLVATPEPHLLARMDDALDRLLAGVTTACATALPRVRTLVVVGALFNARTLVALDKTGTEALLDRRTLLLRAEEEALDASTAVTLDVHHLTVLGARNAVASRHTLCVLSTLVANLAGECVAAGLLWHHTFVGAPVVAAFGSAITLGIVTAHVIASADWHRIIQDGRTLVRLLSGAYATGIDERVLHADSVRPTVYLVAGLVKIRRGTDVGAAVVTALLRVWTLRIVLALGLACPPERLRRGCGTGADLLPRQRNIGGANLLTDTWLLRLVYEVSLLKVDDVVGIRGLWLGLEWCYGSIFIHQHVGAGRGRGQIGARRWQVLREVLREYLGCRQRQ